MVLNKICLCALLIGTSSFVIGSAAQSKTSATQTEVYLFNEADVLRIDRAHLKELLAPIRAAAINGVAGDRVVAILALADFHKSCQDRDYKITSPITKEKLKQFLDSDGKVHERWAKAVKSSAFFDASGFFIASKL